MQATIELNGVRIFYDVGGAGPPVLLIMGLGTPHVGWQVQLPAFRERYRAAAEKVSTGALAEYGRYSPVDGQAAAAHGERLAAHIERLRDLNARLDAMHGALDAAQIGAPAGAGDDVHVRLNDRGATSIETAVADAGGDPVIVEEVRMRVPETNVTRHSTIVRRGERVITIRRPRSHETYVPGVLEYESDDATQR